MLVNNPRTATPFAVPAGRDRPVEDGLMIWGVIPLSIKLSARDTAGELLVFMHPDMGKGGPPRHVHHAQDEWFYVVAGEFIAEVGDQAFTMRAVDSLFAPRRVPHAWAHVGDGPGTLLTVVSPAGTFEDFIRDTTRHPTLPPPDEIAAAFAAHDMAVLGPPLTVR